MKSAVISGDIGDIIYSLCAIKALGVELVYLNVDEKYKLPGIGQTKFNENGAHALKPLIEAQPYIKEVRMYKGEKVDYNFDLFRYCGDLTYQNLCEAMLKTFGLSKEERNKQWLFIEPVATSKPVLINKTDRYLNRNVDWNSFLQHYGGFMAFVGIEKEYESFINEHSGFINEHKLEIPFYPTKDFLELAKLISGCSIFIGNQSSPYSIAEGLKKDTIQVVCDECPNCIFPRDNAIYVPNEYMIKIKN
jgi:hypothetical protein